MSSGLGRLKQKGDWVSAFRAPWLTHLYYKIKKNIFNTVIDKCYTTKDYYFTRMQLLSKVGADMDNCCKPHPTTIAQLESAPYCLMIVSAHVVILEVVEGS